MTFAELKTATFRELGEDASSPAFFTVADVEDAINDGYMELSDETEWYETSVLIDLLQSQRHYDLRTLVSDHVLSLGRAYNRTTSRWLDPVTLPDLESRYTRWEVVTGQPTAIYQRGVWTIGYWPMVATAVGTIKQYYTALPDALSLASDAPGFPARFHRALVEYATSVLWPQQGQVDRALAAWQRYLGYEASVLAYREGRASMPIRRRVG